MWEFLFKWEQQICWFIFGLMIMLIEGCSIVMPAFISTPLALICFVKIYRDGLFDEDNFDYAVMGYMIGLLIFLYLPLNSSFSIAYLFERCLLGGLIIPIIISSKFDETGKLGLAFCLGMLSRPITPTILVSLFYQSIIPLQTAVLGAFIFAGSAFFCYKVLK